MPDETQQFRILYRVALARLIDFDVFSGTDGGQKLAVRLISLLAGLSFALAFVMLPRYVSSDLPPAQLLRMAANDEEFLISITIAIAGLFVVFAWNSVFPGPRDSFVLGLLPVRRRTYIFAKLAALFTALGVGIAAVNAFTGLVLPFVGAGTLEQAVRSFAAWWVTMFAAGSFAVFSILAVQGVASQLLAWRLFLRISSLLQFLALSAVLGFLFLTPAFGSQTSSGSFFPSFWFTGLFHWLRGGRFGPLATQSVIGLTVAAALAGVAYASAHFRNMRRIVETPDIQPGHRGRFFTRILNWYAGAFHASSSARAILGFTARTLMRSRQHRLLIACLGGIGFAIAFAFSRSFLEGVVTQPWNRPSVLTLNAGVLLLFFAIAGVRAIFVLPAALPANWVFRVTSIQKARAYIAGSRKTLILLVTLPVWSVCALVYFAIWPFLPAVQHAIVLLLIAAILTEASLYRFHKIPFTCSYVPPETNRRMKVGLYCVLFLAFSNSATGIEFWAMQSPARFAVFVSVLFGVALWAHRRTLQSTRRIHSIQFEDVPSAELLGLNLEGALTVYIDAPESKDQEIEEEIECHVRMAIRDRVERGEPFEQARRAVLREFGNTQLMKERTREVWRWTTVEQILHDLRSGTRILKRAPLFSMAAVALIAVGIGGNTAIFSMIHAILTKPAPGVTGKRLVVFGLAENGRLQDPSNSFPNYLDYAAQSRTMQSLVAFGFDRMTTTLQDGTYELRGELVTPAYFDTLGIHLVKGRAFTASEASGASGLAAVIAWHVWQNQFHGEENIVGRPVVLNGIPATVIGVTAQGFHGTQFAPNFEVGVPIVSYLRLTRREFWLTERSQRSIVILGKLASGVSLSDARAEFIAISKRLQRAYPDSDKAKLVMLAPYSATAFGVWESAQARVFMRILIAVGLLTLLIVCANVANLMLGRSVARQREMAVRQSMGGSRLRILRMLLSEALVLSLIASGAAFLFTLWVSHAVVKLIPPIESGARLRPDLTPDWSVAAYGTALAVCSALAFMLAPSLRLWRQELLPWLKAGEHGVAQGRSRLANVLVILQLALCVLLLTGAGLASRSVHLIGTADLGFKKDHLLIVRVSTSGAAGTEQQNLALLERLRERLVAVPGVVSASYASAVPPSPWGQWTDSVRAAGSTRSVSVRGIDAGPDYLAVLGVRPVVGSGISRNDIAGARKCAVITRHLAETLWEGQSAVGHSIVIGHEALNVIGIAPDAAFSGIGAEAQPNFVFLPERATADRPGMRLFQLRYSGGPRTMELAVRAAIRQVDARVPVSEIETMEAELEDYTAPAILIAALLGCFSLGSLAIATIGLYAVVAFHTARRTRDFGIRIALGASPQRILGQVLREGLLLAACGAAIGLGLSRAAGRALHSILYGLSPTDGLTYVSVLALLAVISLTACYVPARRAARTDPMQALRED